MAEDLTVRRLEQDQWPVVMSLAARSFLGEPFMIEMFGADPVRRFVLADKLYRSAPWPADEQHLAAFVGDVLVGFCLRSSPVRCHAWISRVAVDPALHGAGIGRTLMAHALAQLRAEGAAAVLLECQSHRENFYVACGFHRVRTFPDPVGPYAILMRADLRPR